MEKMFNPDEYVLQLYYEMLVSKIHQIQSLFTDSTKEYFDGQTSLKKYVVSFIASMAYQENKISEDEITFIQDIIGEEVNLSLMQDINYKNSVEELIDCLCLANVLLKNGNKNAVIDLFNFCEEIGQTFLIRFGTPKRIEFYNAFMNYEKLYISKKCPKLIDLLEFRTLSTHFSYPTS